ncbi:MAG: zinc finger Ran-binding domain-containing protein [Verrucomicrobiae bacterium]|nr:zinc finger Ran-binding domain-containing protein [Verrucomicrobiae bacterium]
MIKCNVCGYDNPLGRVHCIQCGSKIDLSKVVPPNRATGARGEVVVTRRGGTGGRTHILRAIWKVVDLIILAALGIGIVLMWREPAVRDILLDAPQAVAAQAKLDTLAQSAQSGKPATVELSEAEINSYLNHPASPRRLRYAEDTPGATFQARLAKYQIQLEGGNQFTIIGVGEIRVSKSVKRVILRLDGSLVDTPGGRRMKFNHAYVGELPLHKLPAGQPIVDWFAEFFFRFQTLDAEWKLIKGARDVQLAAGKAVVAVGPAAVTPAAGAPAAGR